MSDRLGVHRAAKLSGLTTTFLYVAALKRLIPSELSPAGKVLFDPVALARFQAEETARRARREAEKTEAAARAARLRELLDKRRAARP